MYFAVEALFLMFVIFGQGLCFILTELFRSYPHVTVITRQVCGGFFFLAMRRHNLTVFHVLAMFLPIGLEKTRRWDCE